MSFDKQNTMWNHYKQNSTHKPKLGSIVLILLLYNFSLYPSIYMAVHILKLFVFIYYPIPSTAVYSYCLCTSGFWLDAICAKAIKSKLI